MLRSYAIAGAAGLLFLCGCSGDLESTLGLDDSSSNATAALVVGDEPYAVKAGASILAQGGNAADAATAIYFALAATYPVSAGLGGGGICIVHDAASGRNDEFDFLTRDASGGGVYAVPGNVRGFSVLHNAYGTLPWQRVIAPGEGYAATGFPISQALAARLSASENVIRLDADLAAEFLDESGHAKTAGTVVSNSALAATLAQIRTSGQSDFYSGSVALKLVGYSSAQGGAFTKEELAAYAVGRGPAGVLRLNDETVYVPSRQTGAGAFIGALMDDVQRAQETQVGARDPEATIIVAVKEALARFGVAALPKDMGSTGFAAMDGHGQAVACAVTMNGPFGSGHNVQGTGVTLARAPKSADTGLASAFLTPVIATNANSVALAGTGTGGPNGSAAIAYALLRLSHGEGAMRRSEARSTGTAPFDTVNAIVCEGASCAAMPDPGGNGLGMSADQD